MYTSQLNNVRKINDRLYCIIEVESIHRYLILGNKKAMLFDTGYGYTDVTTIIKEITSLPLIVVNSHGDPDHALGSYQFSEVYIHQDDYNMVKEFDKDSKQKLGTIEYRIKKLPSLKDAMNIEAYIKPNLSSTQFHFIKDEDVFDLGDLTIQFIHVPGHTFGSIVAFCKETGWLFSGDTVDYYNIFYQLGLGHHAPFKTFVSSLRKLEKYIPQLTHIYPAHGQSPIPPSAITETIEGVYDLINNYQQDEVKSTMVGEAYAHYYKNIFILYTKEVLEEALAHGLD